MATLRAVVSKTIEVVLSESEFWLIRAALESQSASLQQSDLYGDFDDVYALRETFKDFEGNVM